MTVWACRVEIPVEDLGRLRLPRARIRYKDGYVRLGYTWGRTRITATLEDREGRLLPAPTQVEACAKAALMGRVIAYRLMKHNRYHPGEDAGQRGQARVSLWDNSIKRVRDFDPACLRTALT